jgi:hypothetical protein
VSFDVPRTSTGRVEVLDRTEFNGSVHLWYLTTSRLHGLAAMSIISRQLHVPRAKPSNQAHRLDIVLANKLLRGSDVEYGRQLSWTLTT